MARKRQLIVTRNGEFIAWPETREEAEAEIERQKANDLRLAQEGWISVRSLELIRYHIEVH